MAIDRTEIMKVRLDEKTIISVQAENLDGQPLIAAELPPAFDEISPAIEGIAKTVIQTMRRIGLSKGAVEFGLQVAVEAGHLTTLLVKGSEAASLKITLEWDRSLSPSTRPLKDH